jgi:hypothetical protein
VPLGSPHAHARPRRSARRVIAAAFAASIGFEQLLIGPAAALTPQTITFDLPASHVVGTSIDLSTAASASSGLPVAFASDTPSICTVTSTTLDLVAEGTCTVAASQPGDETWDPAPDVQDSMTVDPAPPPPPDPDPQTITFTLPSSGYVGSTVPLTGTASSGLPVTYTVETPAVCASDGTTLALDAAGTCTVAATQAGDTNWLPAADVPASITVKLSPLVTADGANLGRYALNGPIQSTVIDPDTGVTYVGGTFTQIGVRTGSVALVDPPDSGSDALKSTSPDVIGSQLQVFPDDATHYFVAGHIGSVNGDGVKRDIVNRLTTTGTIDTSWSLKTTCGAGPLPNWAQNHPRWDLGDRLAVNVNLSPTTSGDSTIGLAFIDKATGVARRTGAGDSTCGLSGRIWPSTPVFAPLASCASWIVCVGYVSDVVEDPGSNSLIVAVGVLRGETIATEERRQTWLMAYDLTTGARNWAIRLESSTVPDLFPPNADWGAYVGHFTGLGGAVLVSGRFPLEAVNRPMDEFTNTMLIDVATGGILQRWNRLGEQSVADPLGDEISPPSACNPADGTTSYERWRFAARSTTHSVGFGLPSGPTDAPVFPVCDYAITGSGLAARLSATSLGSLAATQSSTLEQPLPSALYDGHILVGPFDAFDLDSGATIAGWHPSPSSGSVTAAVAGPTIAIVGDATFIHGRRAFHVAALDRDLAPVDGFDSGLLTPSPSDDWFRQLALDGDQLVVVGRLRDAEGAGHLAALDKTTGDVDWMAHSDNSTHPWAVTVDPVTGDAYVGHVFDPGTRIERYVRSGGVFQLDPDFTPALAGIDGAASYVTALAWIGGRLYAGGGFTSIDGQPREGLARFGVDGSLDDWAPGLLTEMAVPAGSSVEVQPIAFIEVGGRVVVTGRFDYLTPIPGGGGSTGHPLPVVRVYSATTGALVRPLDGASWFGNDAYQAYGSALLDGVVYVALGGSGIGAFDATSFDYLPYLSVRTFAGWGSNEIYAVAARSVDTTAALSRRAAATAGTSIVVGGVVPTWKAHTASNVVELKPGALNSDHAAPSVSGVVDRPRAASVVGSAAPWTIGWTGKDTGGSGVARYEVARSLNGGGWTTVDVDVPSAAAAVTVIPGSTYRFRVRAVDHAGNVGGWSYGATFRVSAVQQSSTSVHYRGTWSTSMSASTWWGGSAKSSSSKGATASLTFSGRSIAWVGLKAANRGKAYVYVNGVLKATVDLRSTTTLTKRVVWSAAYSTSATRTVMVKVIGTSGRPRIDVDGFLIGR